MNNNRNKATRIESALGVTGRQGDVLRSLYHHDELSVDDPLFGVRVVRAGRVLNDLKRRQLIRKLGPRTVELTRLGRATAAALLGWQMEMRRNGEGDMP